MSRRTERLWPWILAFLLMWLLSFTETGFLDNPNIGSIAHTAIVCSAVIIGFTGAFFLALPAFRARSKKIEMVLDIGGSLLKEYVFSSMFTGLIFIAVSFVVMFEDSYTGTQLYDGVFAVWSYLAWLFIFTSIRSFSAMSKTMLLGID